QSSIDNRQSAIPVLNPDSCGRAGSAGSKQSSIDNGQSAFPKAGTIGNPGLDDLRLQWRVERLIGVFLCSEAYHAFKAAEHCNRRVEEAFGALERALEPALQRLVG